MTFLKWSKSSVITALTVFLLSMLLFLTPLDNNIFDLFLRVLPSLSENPKVYVLTLDDDSINFAGGFPFRREVMADVIVLLKELGVETIAFDLSYLDESARRFDEDYALDVFDQHLPYDNINFEEVVSLIPILGRDVDEYFAQAIAFTGRTWLTLTFIAPENIILDDEANSIKDAEIDSWLAENIALKNVTNTGDTKTREMGAVIPAIHKLMSRSIGAGFVNAPVDRDGLRRRIHLLLKYNGDYYGQLSLLGIQNKLGFSSIEVSNRFITLKMNEGSDLRIPRSQDGSILLKWPKKNFYDYYHMSLVQLIQHTTIEQSLANNVAVMYHSGFLDFWDGGNSPGDISLGDKSPWDYYLAAEEIKKTDFENNRAASPEWLLMRQNFFETLGAFLDGPYEENIIYEVSDYDDVVDFVQRLFETCRREYSRIIEIRNNAENLKDSFVVIGSDATSMTDIGINTFQEFYPNVGTYTVVANKLLSGEFLNDSPWYVSAIIALIFSLVIGIFISRFDTYKSIITGVSGLILLTAAFLLFFITTKIYIGFAVPLASTLVTFLAIMINKFLTTSREKAFIHNAFSRYLAPEVISQIINDPDKLNLGGEKRMMTAIFTDIQGFSTISEQLDPTHLVKLLNKYLTTMSNIIMENQGTIDKYEGDAIIAFWGAPLHTPDHPVLACRSAIAMKAAEREINKTVVEEGLSPVPIFTRIGINTGEMVVGNMGAENKMDYTIMGNAVNLTARLEGVNKHYRTGGILISEYTREKIGDEFLLRRLDRVRVVGIYTPLRLYEVINIYDQADSAEKEAVVMWEQAIDLYENKKFGEALQIFNQLTEKNTNDNVVKFYAARCAKLLENPPPEEWDAINNLTEK